MRSFAELWPFVVLAVTFKDYNSQAGGGTSRLAHELCRPTVAAGWAEEATLLTAKPPERKQLSGFSRKSVNSLGETGNPKACRWD